LGRVKRHLHVQPLQNLHEAFAHVRQKLVGKTGDEQSYARFSHDSLSVQR
jgi:hypothetical protein